MDEKILEYLFKYVDIICPQCGSTDWEYVDEDKESMKVKCNDCHNDYIIWADGTITDRHNCC